jgi:hypothetical protein
VVRASGYLIFARGGNLFAVRFDPKTLAVSGSPFPVVSGIATDVSTGAVDFSIANNGVAAWMPAPANTALRQVWVDRHGIESPVPLPAAPYNELALSPDGKRVALTGGQGGVADLWVYDFERDTMTRLTVDQNVSRPVWSPDGKRIAYGLRVQGAETKGNTWRVAWRLADGSENEEILLERERATLPSGFTPDGRELLIDAFDVGTQYRKVMVLSLAGEREPRLLLEGVTRFTARLFLPMDVGWRSCPVRAANRGSSCGPFRRETVDGRSRARGSSRTGRPMAASCSIAPKAWCW